MCPVSEPIALNLRENSENIYLYAQIFAAFMYVGAASCIWLLRAWKVGQLERIALEQEKTPTEVDVLSTEPAEGLKTPSERSLVVRSSIARRLIAWKKV